MYNNKQENTKGLGNPMVTQVAKSMPPWAWIALIAIGGIAVYKLRGVFSAVGSAGNTVSTILDNTSSGLNKVFESLGLKDVPDKEIALKFMDTLVYKQAFNQQYWRDLISAQIRIQLFSVDEGKSYAQKLYDAINVWTTNDEQVVYGVLNAIPTHAHLSYLCTLFYSMYGKDLYQWISSGMWGNGEMRNCIAIVCAKPAYNLL